jgi:hypothetical protein
MRLVLLPSLVVLLFASSAWAQGIRSVDQRPFRIQVPPASAVVLGTDATRRLTNATVQGAGDPKVQLATGAVVAGDVPKYDANGGLVDSGSGPAATAFINSMIATTAMAAYGGL